MTLDDFGLNASRLMAGFAGGVVHAFAFRETSPLGFIASVIAGTLTANYLGPAAIHYAGDWIGEGGSSFAVGLCGMTIIRGMDLLVRKKFYQAAKTAGGSNG